MPETRTIQGGGGRAFSDNSGRVLSYGPDCVSRCCRTGSYKRYCPCNYDGCWPDHAAVWLLDSLESARCDTILYKGWCYHSTFDAGYPKELIPVGEPVVDSQNASEAECVSACSDIRCTQDHAGDGDCGPCYPDPCAGLCYVVQCVGCGDGQCTKYRMNCLGALVYNSNTQSMQPTHRFSYLETRRSTVAWEEAMDCSHGYCEGGTCTYYEATAESTGTYRLDGGSGDSCRVFAEVILRQSGRNDKIDKPSSVFDPTCGDPYVSEPISYEVELRMPCIGSYDTGWVQLSPPDDFGIGVQYRIRRNGSMQGYEETYEERRVDGSYCSGYPDPVPVGCRTSIYMVNTRKWTLIPGSPAECCQKCRCYVEQTYNGGDVSDCETSGGVCWPVGDQGGGGDGGGEGARDFT